MATVTASHETQCTCPDTPQRDESSTLEYCESLEFFELDGSTDHFALRSIVIPMISC